MRQTKAFKLAIISITASLYIVMTISFAPISFLAIQLRFSELLNLLAFINPIYGVGVIIGCFLSNITSPLGPIDMIVGTSGTILAVFLITKARKNLFIATLAPTLAVTPIGIEIWYIFELETVRNFVIESGLIGIDAFLHYALSLILTILSVMIGEFAVVTCIGYPLFKSIINNKKLYYMLSLQN